MSPLKEHWISIGFEKYKKPMNCAFTKPDAAKRHRPLMSYVLQGETMNKPQFYTVTAVYIVLLAFTGYLAFFKFPGAYSLPTPQMVKTLAGDAELKQELLDDVRESRARHTKIIELASQSFNIILGALLGFLSAIATGSISISRNKPRESEHKQSSSPNADDAASQKVMREPL